MNWARNLLFLLVCTGAVAALAAGLFPADARHAPQPAAPVLDVSDPAVARVDAAFTRAWTAAGVEPSAAAPQLAILRRMALALAGTIPSLEEIRRIEGWPSDERVSRYLSQLLADRRSADFVAERLARAYVGVDDGPFLLFRRRRFVSWLADQLAENAPYDQIARHVVADDGLWTDTPAVNFITVTIDPDESPAPDANKLAARVARAFLGVRLDCAECHDHPFDRWKQQDFQSLAAFFGETRNSLRGIRDSAESYQVENRQTGELQTVAPAAPFATQLVPDVDAPRQRLAGWLTHRDNRAFSRTAVNRAWAILFGRPLAEPIDNLPIDSPVHPALDLLADDFVAHGYDWRRLLTVIASTRAFQLDSALADETANPAQHQTHWAAFPLVRLRPEQVVGALLQSASLSTIDSDSHIVVRLARAIGQNDFIRRYGDSGAEEFDPHGGTIPQRLLLMNGEIVHDRTEENLLANAATRIASLAPDDATAMEVATLAVLTRRPDDVERQLFGERLAGTTGSERARRLGDLVWALVNSTEFSWNH